MYGSVAPSYIPRRADAEPTCLAARSGQSGHDPGLLAGAGGSDYGSEVRTGFARWRQIVSQSTDLYCGVVESLWHLL